MNPTGPPATTEHQGLNRQALVQRHDIHVTAPHPEHVLTVGNGDFGYTADITGMQTFAAFHNQGAAAARGEVAVDTSTMSTWSWHEMPNPDGFTLADAMTTYDTARGPVTYPDKYDMESAMRGGVTEEFRAGSWLHVNPQRFDLGRVGLELCATAGADPETDPHALEDTAQHLDLWNGRIRSSFRYANEGVTVETVADPESATVAFRIKTALLVDGRARVVLRFPYASDAFFMSGDWTSPDRHTSTIRHDGQATHIDRRLDSTEYTVTATSALGTVTTGTDPHTFFVNSSADDFDLVISFYDNNDQRPEAASFDAVATAAAKFWQQFWMSGAALELASPSDPRAAELERRVVLSQYLTRVHCASTRPPQETGFATNSWQGKFHLEMHYWHAAHFAAWGRPDLLERSLPWYKEILPAARATATRQGYPGARWPKHVGPDGRESPSEIGALLAWQQPHILTLLESVWQASSIEHRADLLAGFGEIVEDTADFMAAFPESVDGVFHLGPPIMPAQEFYDARITTDPTFELAYWWWGLEIAQTWRERAGIPRHPEWSRVQDNLAHPRIVDGRYAAVASDVEMRRDDHPSLLMAFGVVPPTPLMDPEVMRATLHDVLSTWEWSTAWAWDFPVMAMTAHRLGETDTAIDALLRDEQKNQYSLVGHCRQIGAILPIYLPANGSLLTAVALLAGHPDGFPPDWTVTSEGFGQKTS